MDNLTLVQTKQTDWTVERTSLKIHIQSVSVSVLLSLCMCVCRVAQPAEALQPGCEEIERE